MSENVGIIKDLKYEANLTDDVIYIPLVGESSIKDFKSPDFFVFIFFEKAKGTHTIDSEKYEEKDNQIHISFPGQVHSWDTNQCTRGHKLIVSKKYIEIFSAKKRFTSTQVNYFPVVDLPLDISEKLTLEFEFLKNEYQSNIQFSEILKLRALIIITIIDDFLNQFERSSEYKRKNNPTIGKFIEYVDANFAESRAVAFYAEKLAVTSNYLNILSRKNLGITAKDVINTRIVIEAKRLLLGSNVPIKQIAYDLGFQNPGSFSVFILKKTGFYPKCYREMVSENPFSFTNLIN
ncbi:helix-turn-helix domain-containing protein [Chryseobacterium camelliae]|uniref:Helix-turn-helix domain-containing protein n=1 Tax=Chryseobacterium camelliae TaxID=1265445 RepID=A0ABY7QNJ4_9FLAO|nr:helix-turn-helix transcriptional regulator [Chryseobacterium camelliae]WBV61249.1 helix-turn-helix domain-containing protein [Chryseobacterium camelliae]